MENTYPFLDRILSSENSEHFWPLQGSTNGTYVAPTRRSSLQKEESYHLKASREGKEQCGRHAAEIYLISGIRKRRRVVAELGHGVNKHQRDEWGTEGSRNGPECMWFMERKSLVSRLDSGSEVCERVSTDRRAESIHPHLSQISDKLWFLASIESYIAGSGFRTKLEMRRRKWNGGTRLQQTRIWFQCFKWSDETSGRSRKTAELADQAGFISVRFWGEVLNLETFVSSTNWPRMHLRFIIIRGNADGNWTFIEGKRCFESLFWFSSKTSFWKMFLWKSVCKKRCTVVLINLLESATVLFFQYDEEVAVWIGLQYENERNPGRQQNVFSCSWMPLPLFFFYFPFFSSEESREIWTEGKGMSMTNWENNNNRVGEERDEATRVAPFIW